jgi:hypothetical protein
MSVGKPFIERPLEDGSVLKFRKLTPYDRAEVIERDRSRRRKKLLANLKDAGADKGEIVASLNEFEKDEDERQKKNLGLFIDIFNTPAGKADVIDLALSVLTMKRPGEQTWEYLGESAKLREHVDSLGSTDALVLAAEIASLKLGEPEEVDDDPADEGNPDPNSQTGPTNPTA